MKGSIRLAAVAIFVLLIPAAMSTRNIAGLLASSFIFYLKICAGLLFFFFKADFVLVYENLIN